MKTKSLIILFTLMAMPMFAQTFEVPKAFDPKGPEAEYAKYTNDVYAALDWLVNTPAAEQPEKRRSVNAFLISWLTGTPAVSLEMKTDVVNFLDCANCLPIFLGGYAKYALQSGDKSGIKGSVAGIESTLQFYEKNKAALGKIKELDEYAKKKEKGQLEKVVTERFNKS